MAQMDTDTRASGRRRALFIVLSLLAGGGLAFASWILQSLDPWWSNLLANIAVVVLLLIPGELLLTGIRKQFERVENTAIKAEAAAERAQQTADATARSLDDIRQTLVDRQIAELESELDEYRNITKSPSREALLTALRKATQDEIITSDGVRVPVWETEVHYRFVVDDPNQGALTVQLEYDDGSIISATPWEADVAPEDFYQLLVQAVRDSGNDLGTALNIPTQSVEELVEMLVDVTRLRSQELAGHRNSLRKIIERRNGWYFTEKYVIPTESLSYCVDVSRLNEMDWEEHLRNKGWYSAPDAIQFARRLYGVDIEEDAKRPTTSNSPDEGGGAP